MLYLGTSGWPQEGDWAELSPRKRRERYFDLFNSVEILTTYRRIPDWDLVSRRRAQAPAGFVYSWLAPRYLTYRESGAELRSLRRFLKRHTRLGRARGGVRFLVPASVAVKDFTGWLEMLARLELPGKYAFVTSDELAPLLKPYPWVRVNSAGRWRYQLDKEPPPQAGFAYYSRLAAALRQQKKVAPQRR